MARKLSKVNTQGLGWRRSWLICDYPVEKSKIWAYCVDGGRILYEGWNFNSGNYLFTTDTK